jgi:DNA-binding FadR family transcriptional regulator
MLSNSTERGSESRGDQRVPTRRSNKVSDQIAHWILDEIVSRKLPEGAPLESEAVMVQRYAVSRASLREALRLLEAQGVLTMKPGPGGGPRVARPTALDFGNMVSLHLHLAGTTIRELTAAQILLEPQCAALAAMNRSKDDMKRLDEALIVAYEMDPHNGSDWQRESMHFHDLVMEMANNRTIGLFARSLKEIFTDRASVGDFHPVDSQAVKNQHQAIAEAIRAKDSEGAYQLMKSHTEAIVKYFGRRFPGILDEVVSWR